MLWSALVTCRREGNGNDAFFEGYVAVVAPNEVAQLLAFSR